jgi:hypothetical protein
VDDAVAAVGCRAGQRINTGRHFRAVKMPVEQNDLVAAKGIAIKKMSRYADY